MKRESHLFACHKYLEEVGSQILVYLAKADFRDLREIGIVTKQIENYVATLENHARWEEEFIFKKFFSKDEVATFFGEHSQLESLTKNMIEALKVLVDSDLQARVYKGKLIYLDFRKFYASNLAHFHREETDFLSLLQERATDEEIRAIDEPIYQGMASGEIVEMLVHLFPPINISEKKNILEDLKRFNPANLERAFPMILKLLTELEAMELRHGV